MYCENCGRWLNEGEKCDCRKLEKRKRRKENRDVHVNTGFNGSLFLSILLVFLGLFLYWHFANKDSSALTQYGILAAIYLLGFIFGILSVRKKKWKVLSWVAMLINLFCMIFFCVLMIMTRKTNMPDFEKGKRAFIETEEITVTNMESNNPNISQILTEEEEETEEVDKISSFEMPEETDSETRSESDSLESQITGIWYRSGMIVPTYEFREDGTGTFLSRYPYNWELDDEQTLRITYQDSELDKETFYNVRIYGEDMVFDYETESGSTYEDTCYRTPAYNFYIDGEYNYSEGKVWILSGGLGFSYWVCVDKKGKGLFYFDAAEVEELSSFSNGYAYITGEDYVAIINDKGDVTSKYPVDTKHFVLAYGDGYILTEEFVANFDSSEYVVRLCDYDGKILAQSTRETDGVENDYQITDHTARSAHYCGKGIFGVRYFEGSEFLTSNGEVWSFSEQDFNINVTFYEEMAAQNYDWQAGILTFINTEGELIKYNTKGADINHFAKPVLNDGVCVYECDSKSNLGLYNVETQQALELGKYTNQIYWDMLPDTLRFVDGRITIPFQGEDGELYVGVFDKEWNTILEPVRAEHYYGYSDGYLIVNDGVVTSIYDTSGEVVYFCNVGNQEYKPFSDGTTRLTMHLVGNNWHYNDPAYTFMDEEGNILYDKIDMANAAAKSIYDQSMVIYEKAEDTLKKQLAEGTVQNQTTILEQSKETGTHAGQNGQSLSNQADTEALDGTQTAPAVIDEAGAQEDSEKTGTEDGIHRYEIFLQNGTWEDAFHACLEKGGYLARINTQEENDYIIAQLENLDCRGYRFYIGGRRDLGGQQYFWIDDANAFTGTDLSSADAWCSGNWMIGEPSLKDDIINAEEHVMEIFYYDGESRWVWNDIPNNLPDYIGADAAEKVGYICEYDE